MDKYTNNIYLMICEISLLLFEKNSNYTTYRAYCSGMGKSIGEGMLSTKESTDFFLIAINIRSIFGIDETSSYVYICEFFQGENYIQHEKRVRLNGYLFPNDDFNI